MVGCSSRGELSHLLSLLLLFSIPFENRLQGVSAEIAPPDEPLDAPMSSAQRWQGVLGPGVEAVVDDVGEVAFE